MKHQLFSTGNHWTGLISRVVLGILILPHGLQKTFGWLGGYGFTGTMQWLTETMHIPWIIGFMVIVAEFAGALALILGFASRLWALIMVPLMLGAIMMVHYESGWFMNWDGSMKGEGFEYHIAIIALSILVVLNGSGKCSLDRLIARQENPQTI